MSFMQAVGLVAVVVALAIVSWLVARIIRGALK